MNLTRFFQEFQESAENLARWFAFNRFVLFFSLVLSSFIVLDLLVSCAPRQAEPIYTSVPLRVVMDNNYPPYVFQNEQGQTEGILIDQWKLWQQTTGVKVEITALPWKDALEGMNAGQFDVLDTVFQTPEREKIYEFGPVYASINIRIFFHNHISGIAHVDDLRGFRVAVKDGDADVDYLLKHQINDLVYYPSYEAIVQAAASSNETIFVMDEPPALYYLYKFGVQDQFKFSEPLYGGEFHRAVQKGNTTLLNRVNQGFASISSAEYKKIEERWLGTRQPFTLMQYFPIIGWIIGATFLIILLLIIFNRVLQGRVQVRTLELREALFQLQKSETRFRQVIEFLPVPITISDHQGTILSLNRKFIEHFGYTLDDIPTIQQWMTKAYPDPGYRSEVMTHWIEDVNTSTEKETTSVLREYYVNCKDGSRRYVEIVMHPVGDLWVASINDITEQKRITKALRESELKYRGVYEYATDALFLISDNVFVDCNPRALQMFACPREYLIGQPSYRFSPPTQPDGTHSREKALEKLAAALVGSHQFFEWTHARLDGSLFETDISLNRITLNGKIFIQATVRDITERKRAEKIQNVIYRISQAATSTECIEDLYRLIHSLLSELIPVENFYIALYDQAADLINFPYYVDRFDEKPCAVKPGRGLTEYVLQQGRPVLISRDGFADLLRQGEVELVGTQPTIWLGAPLKVDERIIGVMVVQSYSDADHFDQESLNLLEFVSTQVALTIERKRVVDELRSLSITDDLTGLYNRRGFVILAEQQVKQAYRMKGGIYLVFADVDGLKNINDSLGHQQGDLALREVAVVLSETFREADILSRYGGDEFVVLAQDTGADSATTLVSRLQQSLDSHNQKPRRTFQLSLSIGVTRFDPDAPSSVSDLIARADALMYKQKQNRGN